jgi:hypothetical protein
LQKQQPLVYRHGNGFGGLAKELIILIVQVIDDLAIGQEGQGAEGNEGAENEQQYNAPVEFIAKKMPYRTQWGAPVFLVGKVKARMIDLTRCILKRHQNTLRFCYL